MASHLMHNALSLIKPGKFRPLSNRTMFLPYVHCPFYSSDYLGLQMPPRIESIEEKSRASFPLGLSHSSYYVRPRMALIG